VFHQYHQGDQIKDDKKRGECSTHGGIRNIYILVGKHARKRLLRRPRRRWKNNIMLNLREIGWEDMNWIHLAHDRGQWQILINTVMNYRVP
jgi:hypothetical protein